MTESVMVEEIVTPWREPAFDDRTIYQRMWAVLAELPAIGKDSRNEQQNFMFRGHDDVMNALNPLLAKHGVFCLPTILERVTSERTTGQGKTMYEVSLHVGYRFYGAAGDFVEGSSYGEGTDMGDKATSKAMTMAFKSMLAQSFAVSSKEFADPDGETAEETRGRGRAAKPAAPKSWPEIFEWAAVYGDSLGWPVWVQDASELLYKVRESSALTGEQKAELGAKAAAAVVALREAVDPAQMPPVSRTDVQKAWAAVLDGISLPGPEWRMSPDEDERPVFGHYAPGGGLPGLSPSEQAAADEIPFGEEAS